MYRQAELIHKQSNTSQGKLNKSVGDLLTPIVKKLLEEGEIDFSEFKYDHGPIIDSKYSAGSGYLQIELTYGSSSDLSETCMGYEFPVSVLLDTNMQQLERTILKRFQEPPFYRH